MIAVLLETQGFKFALDGNHVVEILRMVKIAALPSETGKVSGFLNYRGETIVVIETSKYFNKEVATYDINSVIVIVNYSGSKFAILTQNVFKIDNLDDNLVKSYDSLKSDFFSSAIKIDDDIYPILNLDKVVLDIERSFVFQ